MIAGNESAGDNGDRGSFSLKAAIHRRILRFLNDAVSAADLEHAKPFSIHDHEGVPIHGHDDGLAHRGEPLLDTDTATRVLELRDREYPLGFRHVRELIDGSRLDAKSLDTLRHHFGEANLGGWSEFPQRIPDRGPGEYEGVVHAALLHTGEVLFITADETTLLWNAEDTTPTSFQDPRNQPHTMPEGYSQLCGHHVFLSDGRLLSVGGGGYGPNPLARWGYKFDPIARRWERTANPMSSRSGTPRRWPWGIGESSSCAATAQATWTSTTRSSTGFAPSSWRKKPSHPCIPAYTCFPVIPCSIRARAGESPAREAGLIAGTTSRRTSP
jgi:hypothetical protein